MLKKIKKVFGKCKTFVVGAIATVSACAMAAVASASDTGTTSAGGLDMVSIMETAGQSLQNSLMQLVQTMIPIIISIFSGSVVIFGVFTLIKLGKKIFGKVAG